MKYPEKRNSVILEGLWGLGKTSISREFAKAYQYRLVSEPSHLKDANCDTTRLREWYLMAHREQESFVQDGDPCVVERSILSTYAFYYALENALPTKEELDRFRIYLEKESILLVYLSPGKNAIRLQEMIYPERYARNIQRILTSPEALQRYEDFFTTILPWQYDIVPIILPAFDEAGLRSPESVSIDIRSALGAQRVSQVNVVCVEENYSGTTPRVLLLRRTPERGGFWQTITGGIHPGEPLSQVAIREVQEETSIKLSASKLLPTKLSYSFPGNDQYLLHEYVFAALIENPTDIKRSDEHTEEKWVSFEEAYPMLSYESNRQALEAVLSQIKKPNG